MNIDELTIGQVREITRMIGGAGSGPWVVGQCYHIRTVTHYWTGKLIEIHEQELVLDDAAWIADTGRFSSMFADGPDEIEPVDGTVIIGRGSIVDAQKWEIKLPRSQK
jgi:hypothetical protein